MSQRGGYRGGYRGRGRPSPYNSDRQRGRRSNDGDRDGRDGKNEPPAPAPTKQEEPEKKAAPEESGTASGNQEEVKPPMARKEKKFSNKARLFVGNLNREVTDDELKKLFEQYGEVREVFLQKDKNFGFVRMAYKSDAERAIANLSGFYYKGRDMKVRFAASSCSVKVSNLHPVVSNELLAEAFSQFGEVESAVVVTDDRGKSLGHGIVDFARKANALNAIQRCRSEHFILTRSPVPVLVTELIRDNDEDGQPEKYIQKGSTYFAERELPPRFAQPGTMEYTMATRWKQAYEDEKLQREELEQRLKAARESLQGSMENLKEQYQTDLIRQELAHHQQEQMRLVEQLRQRGDPLAGLGGLLPGVPPAGHHSTPLLQQPPVLGQQSQPLFPHPEAGGGESGDGGSLLGGTSGALFPPPLMAQKFR